MEDLSDLDHRMFARHPDGYLCRCGQAHNGKPQHCTCMTDFPEATFSDLSARIGELESGIAAHRDWVTAEGLAGTLPSKRLWSLLDGADSGS